MVLEKEINSILYPACDLLELPFRLAHTLQNWTMSAVSLSCGNESKRLRLSIILYR